MNWVRAFALFGVITAAVVASAGDPPRRPPTATDTLRQLEAASRHNVNPSAFLSKSKRTSLLKTANDFASKLAGSDDKKYAVALEGFYKAALAAELDLTEEDFRSTRLSSRSMKGMHAPLRGTVFALDGGSEVSHKPGRSIADDPNYRKNLKQLMAALETIDDLNPGGATLKIVGGALEAENKFPDCVAVGGAGGYGCTGTLIGKNVVVTAGHCYPGIRFGTKVFVGLDINKPGKEYTGRAIRHPKYAQDGKHNDLCVIILDQDVEQVSARGIASASEIDATPFVRAIGYGTTDFDGTIGYGQRRYVDLPVVLPHCKAEAEPIHYGCDPDLELVAGIVGLDKDTCRGDSGGPVCVFVKGEWKLAGATSRATDSAPRVCGDGGIYVRVDKYMEWIKSLEGARW